MTYFQGVEITNEIIGKYIILQMFYSPIFLPNSGLELHLPNESEGHEFESCWE